MEHTFYVIESGMVSVTQRLNDGSERILAVKRDGEFFGEMGLLNDVPRAATVRTLIDSWLIEISQEMFEMIIRRNPAVALTLMRGLSDNLRDSDRLTIAELQLKNQELAKALDDLQTAQAELVRQERVNRELEIASEVQKSILPTGFPASKGLEFGYFSRPAREVGGDFYDVFQLDEEHFGAVVADVSGKSWGAAIFMAVVKALLSREVIDSLSPEVILHRLHKQLLRTSRADLFVTIFYAVINENTRMMRYVRAGHDRPILFRAADCSIELLDVPGRFVGLWPDLILKEAETVLYRGDTLVCYSDGVTDAVNADSVTFGLERLIGIVQATGHMSASDVAYQIAKKVDQYQGTSSTIDDITILVIKAIA